LAIVSRVALVTGGAGFVGRHLLPLLLGEGWEVHCLCLPQTEVKIADLATRGVEIHLLEDDSRALRETVYAVRPDVVFHLASLFKAEHEPGDVEPLVSSNVLFGCLLLDAASEAGCRSVVNIGTSWQHYGDAGYDPVCLYAATKQAFEDLAEFYVRARGLAMVTLVLFDTYGPADDRPKLVPSLIDLARGRRLGLSSGEQMLDLVYVGDVAAAVLMAAERLLRGLPSAAGGVEHFTVDTGVWTSIRDLVDLIGRLTGEKLAVDWGAHAYRSREVMQPWSGGERLPGWQSQVSLEEGLRRCLAAREGCSA
jgi:nucleoside-diphosphate-sugar epimerase